MLKPYHGRTVHIVAAVENQGVKKESVVENVFQDGEQTIKLKMVLYKLLNSGVLSDIDLLIKQHPYRKNLEKGKLAKDEIAYTLA